MPPFGDGSPGGRPGGMDGEGIRYWVNLFHCRRGLRDGQNFPLIPSKFKINQLSRSVIGSLHFISASTEMQDMQRIGWERHCPSHGHQK